jgi:hypothetical protein
MEAGGLAERYGAEAAETPADGIQTFRAAPDRLLETQYFPIHK